MSTVMDYAEEHWAKQAHQEACEWLEERLGRKLTRTERRDAEKWRDRLVYADKE